MAGRNSFLDAIPILVLFLIFLAIALGALYGLWNASVSVPDLVYNVSAVTESSSDSFLVTTTITITNESSTPAHLVTFWFHDPRTEIKEFKVESENPSNHEEGGEGKDELLIKWERLADHARARVRLKTSPQVALRFRENFFIDAEEGAARDKSQPKELPGKGQALIFVLVGACVLSLTLSPIAIAEFLDKFASRR